MRRADLRKIGLVVRALYDNPGGLWIRQIARVCGLSASTAHHYVELLSPLLDEERLGPGMIRVVRLKEDVREKLAEGGDLSELLKRLRILRDAVNSIKW